MFDKQYRKLNKDKNITFVWFIKEKVSVTSSFDIASGNHLHESVVQMYLHLMSLTVYYHTEI